MQSIMKVLVVCMLLVGLNLLQGCSNETETTVAQKVIAIEKSDQCHLCGMTISKFPGPKGQLYSKGISHNMKF